MGLHHRNQMITRQGLKIRRGLPEAELTRELGSVHDVSRAQPINAEGAAEEADHDTRLCGWEGDGLALEQPQALNLRI